MIRSRQVIRASHLVPHVLAPSTNCTGLAHIVGHVQAPDAPDGDAH